MKPENTIYVEEIELDVEEMEELIAPGVTLNHNETVEVELDVEELEEVIAPKGVIIPGPNHNETLEVELDVEEVEEVIAPLVGMNHNETLING